MATLKNTKVHRRQTVIHQHELQQIGVEFGLGPGWSRDLYLFAPLGYFAMTNDGIILHANLVGATLLGVDRILLSGALLSRFIIEEDQAKLAEHLRQVLEMSETQNCEISIIRTNGTNFRALLHSIAMPMGERRPQLLATIITDIGDWKRKYAAQEPPRQFIANKKLRRGSELAERKRLLRAETDKTARANTDALDAATYSDQNIESGAFRTEKAENFFKRLTPREIDVFQHLVVCGSNKGVASELGISPRTVEIHRARIMKKMGAQSLPQLVRIALSAEANTKRSLRRTID